MVENRKKSRNSAKSAKLRHTLVYEKTLLIDEKSVAVKMAQLATMLARGDRPNVTPRQARAAATPKKKKRHTAGRRPKSSTNERNAVKRLVVEELSMETNP